MDYHQVENNSIKDGFNLNLILEFQLNHDVQIIRGSDWQYQCIIDDIVYEIAITPMGALYYGINKYIKHFETKL